MAEILSVSEQYAAVRKTTDVTGYTNFVGRFFTHSTDWVERVAFDIQQPDFGSASPDYFRFLSLMSIVTAQYGYPSLNGQIAGHEEYGWDNSPASPRHQLAVGVYMARLNKQSYPIKEELIEELGDPTISDAIWGIGRKASKGVITRPDSGYRRVLRNIAETRFYLPRPICLPDRRLNERLAAIEFTGHDVGMSDDEFNNQIYPAIEEIVKLPETLDPPEPEPLFDPEPVFIRDSQ